MIEETGTVKSIDGKIATVNVPKKSACEGCTAGTCKIEEQSIEIEALNQAGAKVGQKVRVGIKSYAYMKGSMVVYGLPALSLVIGAVFGKELMSRVFTNTDSDILSAIFGFAFFVISFVIVKVWINAASKETESKAVIEEIIEQ